MKQGLAFLLIKLVLTFLMLTSIVYLYARMNQENIQKNIGQMSGLSQLQKVEQLIPGSIPTLENSKSQFKAVPKMNFAPAPEVVNSHIIKNSIRWTDQEENTETSFKTTSTIEWAK